MQNLSKFSPYLISTALELAQTRKDGFTVAPDMLSEPTSGYAVAVAATQNNFGTAGFLSSLRHALALDLHFGGWLNIQNGLYYFDAVRVFPEGQLKEAVKFAREQKQIAIFDVGNLVEIAIEPLAA